MVEKPKTIEYPYVKNNDNLKVELINFKKSEKHYILQVGIINLESDNYRLFLKGSCLSVILSEPREFSRPVHMHNINWKVYSRQSYEVLKHVDIWLPGDNFYLIRHFAYPSDQLLEVILGRFYSDEIWF